MKIKEIFWVINDLKLYIIGGVLALALIVYIVITLNAALDQVSTYVAQNGLKSVIERVWYGPDKGD